MTEGTALASDPVLQALCPLSLQMRRGGGSVIGRATELAAIESELEAARQGLTAVTLFADDIQWADEDSLRALRYAVRTDADSPIFLLLALRPEETAQVTEVVTLVADMERMGLIRRVKLGRFTQMET